MKSIIISSLIAILIFPALSRAEKYKNIQDLTGKIGVTGKSLVDAPPGEPRDTHLQVYLTDKSAKLLYDGMKVEPEAERCEGDPDVMSKYIGEMVCQHSVKLDTYECFFGVNIKEQKIEGGWMC